jgi:hypothetical protein
VVPVHIALYGHPPPRISYKIMGNLGKLADWFIEENLSYIRVFGFSVPPHALPRFLPEMLVCREVAYQTVTRGINKELKAHIKSFGRLSLFKLACFHYWISVTPKLRLWPWRMSNWLTSSSRDTIHIRLWKTT